MTSTTILRDILYFDVDKAASLFSQADMGLLRELKADIETQGKLGLGAKVGFSGVGIDVKDEAASKTKEIETRIIHHDLLVRTEEYLVGQGLLVDLSDASGEDRVEDEDIRRLLAQVSYVRVEGWPVIEDYERMRKTANRFNELVSFIRKSSIENLKKISPFSDQYEEIGNRRKELGQQRNKDRRRADAKQLDEWEQRLEGDIGARIKLSKLDDWLVSGIDQFIDTFFSGQVHVRIYPFSSYPGFHILANMDRKYFEGGSLDNLMFAYGPRPDIKLSLLGLITSMPPKDGPAFDPMKEFLDDGTKIQSETIAFEKAFRGMFNGMEDLERLIRFARYPNITVYPLAMYREIKSQSAEN